MVDPDPVRSQVSLLSDVGRRSAMSPELAMTAKMRRGRRTGIVKTLAVCSDATMAQLSTRPTLYKGYRFPPEIISRCVWLYYRFGVSRGHLRSILGRDFGS